MLEIDSLSPKLSFEKLFSNLQFRIDLLELQDYKSHHSSKIPISHATNRKK